MRRLIVVILLFTMVTLTAVGVAGLLGRVLEAVDRPLAGSDTAGLAQSLAFTLIAGPLAALLGWFVWRSLRDHAERASVSWGLYLAAMSSVALITGVTSVLAALASLVDGTWLPAPLATAIPWLLVWGWHIRMARSARGPVRLAGVPWVIGSVFGLALMVGGSITAIATVLDTAFTGAQSMTVGTPWWHGAVTALIWAAGGGLAWWWHWFSADARSLRTGFAMVALVLVVGLGAVILALGGLATALYVGLRLAFDRSDAAVVILEPTGNALAAALIGAAVIAYYRGTLGRSSANARRATRLAASGVALAGAATGIGIIVNSALAVISAPLAGTGALSLMLAGISALAVGGPAWWLIWRPTDQADPTDAGRRVYLAIVFGVSAVVALNTLLVVGARIIESTLNSGAGSGLLEQIRVPLGLLLATVLVAAYHFALWRRDRPAPSTAPDPTEAERPMLGEVILVIGSDPGPFLRALEAVTQAPVTVWQRAEASESTVTPDDVVRALAGTSAPRVLITVGPGASLDVIALKR